VKNTIIKEKKGPLVKERILLIFPGPLEKDNHPS
jgi:hypothetical protein